MWEVGSRKDMNLNLNLAQKGLLLVCVPLAFELCFVSLLVFLHWQAERARDEERHSKEVVVATSSIQRSSYDLGVAVAFYALMKTPIFEERIERMSKRLADQLDGLAAMVSNRPQQAANVQQLIVDERQITSLIGTLTPSLNTQLDGAAVRTKFGRLTHQLESDVAKIIDEENRRKQSLPLSESKAQVLLIGCLVAGIVANIILSMWLSMFFSKDIKERVARIVKNTNRLTQKVELLPPVSGNDEIAHLDMTFHTMAEQIRKVEQLKQDFLNMVSHDLRTPLTSISVTLEMLAAGVRGPLSEHVLKDIHHLDSNTKRLIGLVNNLLDMERLDSGSMELDLESASLKEIAESSVKAIEDLAKTKRIELRITERLQGIKTVADSNRLIQVLINLTSNAIKFSPPDSCIIIDGEEHPEHVEVSVTDEGPGIPEAKRENIFEKYKQVNQSDARQGAGLGLAICKAIIQEHRGAIGVKCGSAGGSTFWFTIPHQEPN